jgi:SAM-dependent methyltransferase
VTEHAQFETQDLRTLTFDSEFDAVICLCQGGFGLLGGGADEGAALGRLARALRPDGRLAVSAFNAYFVLRHMEAGDTFDAARGVNHERSTLHDAAGNRQEFDLWTTCFTPRELAVLATGAGLVVDAVHGVTPGAYAAVPPSLDLPEHLLLAHRP